MTPTTARGRIAVNNSLLEGVSLKAEMPTYILNTLGLSASEVEVTIDSVGLLQAMAPVFRIVLATDQSVFGSARSIGWPVEHFLPAEHRSGTADSERQNGYVKQRFKIAEAHYRDATLLRAGEASQFVESIANMIGRADLAEIANSFAPKQPEVAPNGAYWPAVEQSLAARGAATFDGAEGSARLSCTDPIQEAVFVSAHKSGAIQAVRGSGIPDWACVIRVEFDSDSSLAFEAHLYAALARSFGGRLTVVRPWRNRSLLSGPTLRWVDLGLHEIGAELHVQPEFAEAYEILAGSARFDWDQARRYAAIRRISRGFSNRERIGH